MASQYFLDFNRMINEELFYSVVEAISFGITIENIDGVIIYANPRLCDLMSLLSTELIGKTWETLNHNTRPLNLLRQLLRPSSTKVVDFEIAWETKAGTSLVTLIVPKPLVDKEGQVCGRVLVFTDITFSKPREDTLLLLSRAFEQSPIAMLITDQNGRIDYINQKFCQLSGYFPEEIIGLTSDAMLSGMLQQCWGTNTTDCGCTGVIPSKGKNDEHAWAFEVISPIKDEYGQITNFLAIHENINQRIQIEDSALKQNVTQDYSTPGNPATGMYIEQKGDIVYCDVGFAKLFNYQTQELIGQPFKQLIHPSSIKEFDEMQRKFIEKGHGRLPFVLQGSTRQDRDVWLRGTYAFIDYDAKPAIMGHVMDMTQEKQRELFLQKSERELKELSWKLLTAHETERKLIALELHDGIGQHLNGLKFILERYREISVKSASPDIEPIVKSIAIIEDTISEVRNIAMSLRPSLIDDLGIAAAISWHCRKFQETYKNIKIETDINLHDLQIQNLLEIVIYRILQEALNNVAKHAKAKHIQVHLTGHAGASIQLTVEDDGCGFALDQLLAKDFTKKGLGFISMKERAELAGGIFNIQTKPGAGTIIRASWPSVSN